MKNKKIMLVVTVFLSMTLIGCMSKEEEADLKKITKAGLKYAEEKYGKEFEVVDSGYEYQESLLWPTNTGDVTIELNDGITVVYLSEEDKYYDNLQAEEIVEAVATEIWKPLLEEMEPYDFTDSGEVKVAVNNSLLNESEESFFHEYYEGDIKLFLEKERPWFDIETYKWGIEGWTSTELCLISETDRDWQDRVDTLNDIFKKYFREKNYIFQIVALTQECFDRGKCFVYTPIFKKCI